MHKTLRLLMTRECDRSCAGCCNKQWDLDYVPVCTSYKGYENIIVTGGEPFLYPYNLLLLLGQIHRQNKKANRIVYTANSLGVINNPAVVERLHGLTLTLHEQSDVDGFIDLDASRTFVQLSRGMSLRLNVFEGIQVPYEDLVCYWNVKDEIQWLENCPLPEDEVFMKVKGV